MCILKLLMDHLPTDFGHLSSVIYYLDIDTINFKNRYSTGLPVLT